MLFIFIINDRMICRTSVDLPTPAWPESKISDPRCSPSPNTLSTSVMPETIFSLEVCPIQPLKFLMIQLVSSIKFSVEKLLLVTKLSFSSQPSPWYTGIFLGTENWFCFVVFVDLLNVELKGEGGGCFSAVILSHDWQMGHFP